MITLDYFAGLFDGEGSVYVDKSKTKAGYRCTLKLQITNSDENVMKLIHSQYGGRLRARPLRLGTKLIYDIRWSGKEAKKIINLLLPFTIIKTNELLLSLRFPIGTSGHESSIELIQSQNQISQYLKNMKKNTRLFRT